MTTQPKYRRPLNPTQLNILQLLFKYRFATASLLSSSISPISITAMNSRLGYLLEQEFIGRKYDASYKLQGRPAAYYLRTKAIGLLKRETQASDKALKAHYGNARASDAFVAHCLDSYRLANHLTATYGKRVDVFTKVDLADFAHFPQSIDTFIKLRRTSNTKSAVTYFFLSVIDASTPFFAAVKQAEKYINYDEEGEWEVMSTALPPILLVCSDRATQTRLSKKLSIIVDADDDTKFYCAVMHELLTQGQTDDPLWAPTEGRPVSLDAIK